MKNILKIIYNYMTNIIKINYVTKIELLNPLFINFFKTIPKKPEAHSNRPVWQKAVGFAAPGIQNPG